MSRFQSCLIVTYGRSGSTLLQGVLNTIPGWLIRGENEHFAVHLHRAHAALHLAQTRPYPADTSVPSDPWFGIHEVELARMRADCAMLIRNALVPLAQQQAVRCFGFKEIRYVFAPEELPGYLDFLTSVLPDLAIIFNFRDIDAVMRSAWWREWDQVESRAMIDRFERAAIAYHLDHPTHSVIMRHEQLIRRDQALRALFDFLGETLNPAKLDPVFATTHSTRTLVD